MKGFIAASFQTTFAKPNSNFRLSQYSNSCSFIESNVNTSESKHTSKKLVYTPIQLNIFFEFNELKHVFTEQIVFNFSGNSPPKYILYKCLKIAIS